MSVSRVARSRRRSTVPPAPPRDQVQEADDRQRTGALRRRASALRSSAAGAISRAAPPSVSSVMPQISAYEVAFCIRSPSPPSVWMTRLYPQVPIVTRLERPLGSCPMSDALLFLHVLAAFLLVGAVVMVSGVALGAAAPGRTVSVANLFWDVGGLGTLVFGV